MFESLVAKLGSPTHFAVAISLSGVQVGAYAQSSNTQRNADTQGDGSFSVPVYAGQWSLQVNNTPSGFISPNTQFTVPPVHEPCAGVTDTSVAPAGTALARLTDVAGDGPLFCTCNV